MLRPKPALVALTLSAAAALGYVSYRGLVGEIDEPAPGDDATEPAAAQTGLVERLPEFALENLAGERQSVASWPGKPLLINFWATWCGPCLREIPMLKTFQSDHPGLQVLGIAVDEREPVVEFAANMQFTYPVLIGQSEGWAAAAAFGVNVYALPFTVFTGADGSVLGVHIGELHPEQLENLVTILDDLASGGIDVATARARLAGRI